MTGELTSYAELLQLLAALPLLAREKRRRCGLSLRAAADEIGISFSTLTRFENGENLALSNAVAVLRWVGAS